MTMKARGDFVFNETYNLVSTAPCFVWKRRKLPQMERSVCIYLSPYNRKTTTHKYEEGEEEEEEEAPTGCTTAAPAGRGSLLLLSAFFVKPCLHTQPPSLAQQQVEMNRVKDKDNNNNNVFIFYPSERSK